MATGTPEDVVRRAQERLELLGGQMAELTLAMMTKAAPDFDLKAFIGEHRGEDPHAVSSTLAERFGEIDLPEEDKVRFAELQASMDHILYILTGVDSRRIRRQG